MRNHALIYPMTALVVLSCTVLVRLFLSRKRAVRSGEITTSFYRTFQGAVEPERTAKHARNFSNLFEAPTLFYAASLSAMQVGDTPVTFVILAWGYVAARVVHTVIHLGANRLRHRIPAYFVSWILLVAMWVHIVVHVGAAPDS